MNLIMSIDHLRILGVVTDFLPGLCLLEPIEAPQAERYQCIELTLLCMPWSATGQVHTGLLMGCLCTVMGDSRQHMTRLIRRYRDPNR